MVILNILYGYGESQPRQYSVQLHDIAFTQRFYKQEINIE